MTEQRTLGAASAGSPGLTVSPVGFGCMALTGSYGPVDTGTAEAALRRAVEAGITLFDTADAYADGDNERLVGRVLGPVRDKVAITTKFRTSRQPDGTARIDGSPEHVRRACDRSLARLGVDAIDLYLQHRRDRTVPIDETVGAMGELVAAGKVRHIGLCEVGAKTIERAHATHPLTAVQSEYSLWSRDVEAGVLPTLRRLGIGFVAYSPLGRGFLAGAVRGRADLDERDARRRQPRFADENLDRNVALLERFAALADRLGATPAQAALAWVLAQDEHIVPLLGTTSPAHLQENLGALLLTLGDDELQALPRLIQEHGVAGDRYPPAAMAHIET